MNKQKFYTTSELKAAVKKFKYKLAELVNSQGEKVCPSHSMTMKPETWIDTTLTSFIQRPNKDGIYYVQFYQDTTKKQKPDSYPIKIGNVQNNEIVPPGFTPYTIIKEKIVNGDNPLSWEQALEYQNEIADLKFKLKSTEFELAKVKAEHEVMKSENKEHLSEKDQNDFWKNIVESAGPIADSFFKDRKETRAMQFLTLAQSDEKFFQYADLFLDSTRTNGASTRQPKQNPEEIKKLNAFFEDDTQVSDQEHKDLMSIRDKCKSLDDFKQAVMLEHPEVWKKMNAYVWGGDK